MKHRNLFACMFWVLAGTFPFQSYAQQELARYFNKNKSALLKHNSVAYEGRLKFKFMDRDDTTATKATIFLYRDPSDSLHGGKIVMLNDYTLSIYDGKMYHRFSLSGRSPAETNIDPVKHRWGIELTGLESKLIWTGFMKAKASDTLREIYKGYKNGNDSLIDGKGFHLIKYIVPAEKDYKDWYLLFGFDLLTGLRTFFVEHLEYQGSVQYSDEMYDHIVFDTLSPEFFTLEYQMNKYKISMMADYVFDTLLIEKKPFSAGTAAPGIGGKIFGENMSYDTVSYLGKITLLDFWYIGCPPCGKAIPELNKVVEKYEAGQLQVLGVNSYDNEEKRYKRISTYLDYNPMYYPVLLVRKEIPDLFKISSWPTFYIIDQHGRIAYSHIGYDPNLADIIEAEVNKLLQK